MKHYRIRYLTPREIGHFMGVDDDNMDKILSSGVREQEICKMLGNSIVVNCLTSIFGNLFVHRGTKEKRKDGLW